MAQLVPLPVNAAKLSWNAAVGATVLGIFCRVMLNYYEAQGRDTGDAMPWILDGTALFLIFIGLASGAWALTKIKEIGPEGIVVPAMIGIAYNIILLVIAIMALMIVRNREPESAAVQSDTLSQPIEFHGRVA